MINNIKELSRILLRESDLKYFDIKRVKETILEESIYIYLASDVVIRLSTHHNATSEQRCLVAITTPIKRGVAIKIINNALMLYAEREAKKKDAKERVIKIIDIFGMKYATAAEAMDVTYSTFTKKLNDNEPRHWFNNKNVEDLKKNIAEKAKEIENI